MCEFSTPGLQTLKPLEVILCGARLKHSLHTNYTLLNDERMDGGGREWLQR